MEEKMLERLKVLYRAEAPAVLKRLLVLLHAYEEKLPKRAFDFSEKDAVLITYGDSFQQNNREPLAVLNDFVTEYLGDAISIVHVLPFFPYSSDDGFSVIDYREVNPDLGSWDDVHELGTGRTVMFDAVINHVSAKSREFQGFLKGEEKYRNFFIVVGPEFDISRVFRPRALPLLTRFDTNRGNLDLWTTFSTDQIDLNYRDPDVLLYIIDVLLYYVLHGASIIRLDAIAFMWKESGTECLHLPQTHAAIKLFRNVFDMVAPHVKIITETNVPHSDNISYFGEGNDEAHMVYNFALPPLTVHALLTGDGSYLTQWASTLQLGNPKNYFYNFTASHDGIGLMPARGILPAVEIERLVTATEKHGGKLGLKDNPDGTQSVYELNVSLFDLLSDPNADEPMERQVHRFVASQAVAMILAGVPALYYHSMVGSRNYYEGVERTGVRRAINREKLGLERLKGELSERGSRRELVYSALTRLLRERRKHRAFHPEGPQTVLSLHRQIFAVERQSPDGGEKILSIINLSDAPVSLQPKFRGRVDIITGTTLEKQIDLEPYGIRWLRGDGD
ncbi:MAG: sugar phosphorylase [Spirochaetes bacterium]|nr:sugar phosphorylase [Spirochaetota bacterium]